HGKEEEYSSALDPSNITGISLVKPVKEKQKKFSLFGGKKQKKVALLKETIDEQAKTIDEWIDKYTTEKTSYEAEISRLQAQLKGKDEERFNTMAFGCFKSPKDNGQHGKEEEYSSALDPSNITGISLVKPVKEKQKKFSLFGGKKQKKVALLKETIDEQAKTIDEWIDKYTTDKTSYEAEISRLQAQLKAKDEEIRKLQAQQKQMILTRDAEKKMINENMTLIEKIFAPAAATQETSDASSPVSSSQDVSKKAKKKNSVVRRKKRDQKNQILYASEIGDGVA
uniref:Uncharacterized protein n=1 Tax=Panagrolaimus sp. ES5 TaxID=591445 RepID=A0AC34G6J7_9BILA